MVTEAAGVAAIDESGLLSFSFMSNPDWRWQAAMASALAQAALASDSVAQHALLHRLLPSLVCSHAPSLLGSLRPRLQHQGGRRDDGIHYASVLCEAAVGLAVTQLPVLLDSDGGGGIGWLLATTLPSEESCATMAAGSLGAWCRVQVMAALVAAAASLPPMGQEERLQRILGGALAAHGLWGSTLGTEIEIRVLPPLLERCKTSCADADSPEMASQSTLVVAKQGARASTLNGGDGGLGAEARGGLYEWACCRVLSALLPPAADAAGPRGAASVTAATLLLLCRLQSHVESLLLAAAKEDPLPFRKRESAEEGEIFRRISSSIAATIHAGLILRDPQARRQCLVPPGPSPLPPLTPSHHARHVPGHATCSRRSSSWTSRPRCLAS